MVKKIRKAYGIEMWNRVVKDGLTQLMFEPSWMEVSVNFDESVLGKGNKTAQCKGWG